MKTFRQILIVVALGAASPAVTGAQSSPWPTSADRSLQIEFVRPTQGRYGGLLGDYPRDVRVEGAFFLGARIPVRPGFQIVADLPVASLVGSINGCVDAVCSTHVTALVPGNPLLGVRYAIPDRPLWLQAGVRLPLMSVDGGTDNWQRRVDQYAASAAAAAEQTDRRAGVMPRATSVSVDMIGERSVSTALVQASVGLTWITQASSQAFQVSYMHNTALDLGYAVRISKRLDAAELGVGLTGRRDVHRSPDWPCGQGVPHCRDFLEARLTAGYRLGHYVPAIQVRLPVTETLKRSVRRVLVVGVRATW